MIPAPVSPRPWHLRSRLSPIFDANDKPVSGVENAAFYFAVEQAFDPLVATLQAMTDAYEAAAIKAGLSAAEVQALTIPARVLLKNCEIEEAGA